MGVPRDVLLSHTAVSAPLARAMALGGLSRSPADVAPAVTGVAGPEPDEDGNPVGLAFVAGAVRGGRCEVSELSLPGSSGTSSTRLGAASQ